MKTNKANVTATADLVGWKLEFEPKHGLLDFVQHELQQKIDEGSLKTLKEFGTLKITGTVDFTSWKLEFEPKHGLLDFVQHELQREIDEGLPENLKKFGTLKVMPKL
jgi:ABC-type uncharacterized transport system substrate-binding protein